MEQFAIGDDLGHRVGDVRCPRCVVEFPEPCRCGGLVHAATGEEQDEDGSLVLSTLCDQCGRSHEDLAEAV